MIDDEFDKIVRHMFERFFSGSMITNPDRNVQIRFDGGLDSTSRRATKENQDELPKPEAIDLGDEYIIIVPGIDLGTEPTAHVEGREVNLNVGRGTGQNMTFELPYAVDTDNSSMSFRNGVIEILLPKASNLDTSSDTNDITLSS